MFSNAKSAAAPQMPSMPANTPGEGIAKIYVIEGKRAESPAEPEPAEAAE
jgi:hypothetical protein